MDLVIIGGGAAGMMAGIIASSRGKRVTILEHNEKLGKKLYITGKGRCNLSNYCEPDAFIKEIFRNEKFLYSCINAFSPRAAIDFFERAGCRTVIERGNRIFPESGKSASVLDALKNQLTKYKTIVILNANAIKTRVISSENTDRHFEITYIVDGNTQTIKASSLLLSTGGVTYPQTGSDGSGFALAKSLGHTISPLQPALVPLEVKDDWCKSLSGLSLKNVALTLYADETCIFKRRGEMLFTHFGVSGPLILSASSYCDFLSNKNLIIYVNLKPALDKEQLKTRLLRDFKENHNRSLKNSLNALLPLRLIPIIVSLCGIDPDKKVSQLKTAEIDSFAALISHLPIHVTDSRGVNEAVITRGGVHVSEINPKTMESKLVKGLYFAGEILDTDGPTGGFNLHIAWASGYTAGNSVP